MIFDVGRAAQLHVQVIHVAAQNTPLRRAVGSPRQFFERGKLSTGIVEREILRKQDPFFAGSGLLPQRP